MAAVARLNRPASEAGGFAIWTAVVMAAMLPMVFLVAAVSENLRHQVWADAAVDAAVDAAAAAAANARPDLRGDPAAAAALTVAADTAAAVINGHATIRNWGNVAVTAGADEGPPVPPYPRLRVSFTATYRSRVVFWAGERPVASVGFGRFTSAVAR